MYVFPSLGDRPIGLITVPELFAVLKKVQDTGQYETCKRLRHWCHKIWRYAVVTGRAPTNILLQMRDAFIPVRSENHPAITSPERVGQLLRAIARRRLVRRARQAVTRNNGRPSIPPWPIYAVLSERLIPSSIAQASWTQRPRALSSQTPRGIDSGSALPNSLGRRDSDHAPALLRTLVESNKRLSWVSSGSSSPPLSASESQGI